MGHNKVDEPAITCPTEKIIVRRIPPQVTEEEFKELFTPCVEGQWNGYYRYVTGHVAEDMYDETTFARAYILFDSANQSEQFMKMFREKMNHDPEYFRVERAIYLHTGPFEEEPPKIEAKPLESNEFFQRFSKWYNSGSEGEPPHLSVPTAPEKKAGNGKKSKKKKDKESKLKAEKAKLQGQKDGDASEEQNEAEEKAKDKDKDKVKAKTKAKKEKKKKKQAVSQDKPLEDDKTNTTSLTETDTVVKTKPKKKSRKSKPKSKDLESSSEPNVNSNQSSKPNDLKTDPNTASIDSNPKPKIKIKQRSTSRPQAEPESHQNNAASNSGTVSAEA